MILTAVVTLAVINVLFKAAGPALLGDRAFPPRVEALVTALPVVLLAGLLTVDLTGARWESADWTLLPGLGAALLLRVALGRPHLLCLAVAVTVTIAVRHAV
ncbi:hypothetical protein [Kineosporia succinea]|uniref:Cyanate permease n=1 Tax=Kineosporia succinea TaxID=84632 RepID=A0ABT9NWG9_9ACTN|nr:hypothetical protein [Kineosporia succinea]MDP9824504.1 cyanate permease [Kineosporia succinea]